MSEAGDTHAPPAPDRRRRHRSGGGGGDGSSLGRKIGIAALWILGLFLATNLAVSALRKDETGRPSGLLTEDLVAAVALWVPVIVFAAAGIVGAWFAWCGYQRHEKPGALWSMRAFIVSLVLVLVFVIGVFELDRRWFAVAAAMTLATQTALFAFAAYREHGRSSSSHRSRSSNSGTEGRS